MVRFKMVGRDINSSPTQYRTWVVNNTPDFDGYYYAGLKSGPLPFVDINAYDILDGYSSAVVDFNLPDPLNWKTSFRVMPTAVYNSHLAIIDGYIYMFGGESSDAIYRADINNPADWVDTGANLPTVLSGAQLAVIDGYVYLFGGKTDETVDTIYSATTANPLVWTNRGSKLPQKLHKSQLGIIDGYIYLFGGQGANLATNVIFKASVADPLTWIDTGATLPSKVYGSHLGLLNNRFYLFGGLTFDNSPSNAIYSAATSTPTVWSLDGGLPFPISYGQLATIGDQAYLFVTEAAHPTDHVFLTRILRCDRATPTSWVDTLQSIPGDITQSQLAIIYDRIFLFGGNGSSIIFACNQILKYHPINPAAVAYGSVTRTQYNATASPFDLFKVLGFPYWKTKYGI